MSKYCLTCGNEILEESHFRPKTYCSTNCRNYFKYKNAIEDVLIKLNPTIENKKIIRGDMFRLCNLISNSTITNK